MLTFLVRNWDKIIGILYIAKETTSQNPHTKGEKTKKRSEGNKKYKQELFKPTCVLFDTCMLSKEQMWHI